MTHLKGTKYDGDKPRWDLVPWREVEEFVKVITFGAKKYSPNNWKGVEKFRYCAALARHLCRYMCGETHDPETGLHHMAHIQCNAVFIQWKDNNENEEKTCGCAESEVESFVIEGNAAHLPDDWCRM